MLHLGYGINQLQGLEHHENHLILSPRSYRILSVSIHLSTYPSFHLSMHPSIDPSNPTNQTYLYLPIYSTNLIQYLFSF